MSASSKALQVSRATWKFLVESKGFDRHLSQVEIVSATPGTVRAQYVVTPADTNKYGTLHGGWTSTMVDMVSTLALMNEEPPLPGVSLELSVSYLKAAKIGETVTIDAVTHKKGAKLSYSTVDLRNAAGELLAQGRHTKFLDLGNKTTVK